MTESEAKGFIQGKLDCMNKCNVFEREHSYNTDLCDNCEYCYSQGNFGNQKEAFSVAINALENQMKLNKMGDCYIIPKNGVFEVNGVDVNLAIKKQIPKKPIMKPYYKDMEEEYLCCPTCGEILTDRIPMDNKDFYFHCLNCGQKFNWESDEK